MAPRECKGPRLFVEGLSQRGVLHLGASVTLSSDDGHYLKNVLRLPVGAAVELGDPETGDSYKSTISSVQPEVTLTIVERLAHDGADISITLLCALCKGQKNELICDWATELGCSRIIFWQAERSIVRLRGEDEASSKALKFSKAALAAAQQSRQVRPPKVYVTTSLSNALALADLSKAQLKACCSLEFDAPPLESLARTLVAPSSACLVIGPEGDLTPHELEALKASGFTPASLGRQVLRSELAALTALTLTRRLAP